jgi:hypothetical protein
MDVLVHKAQQGKGTLKLHTSVLGAIKGCTNLNSDVDVQNVGKQLELISSTMNSRRIAILNVVSVVMKNCVTRIALFALWLCLKRYFTCNILVLIVYCRNGLCHVLCISFPFTEIISYVNNVGFETVPTLLQNGTGSGTGISVVYPSTSSDV